MNIGEVVESLDDLGDDDLIWVRDGEYSPTSPAEVRSPDLPGLDRPWRYLLEVNLAAEAIDVWRQWRPYREPTLAEKVRTVVFYGLNDAWEPIDPDTPLEIPLPERPQGSDPADTRYKIGYIRPRIPPPEPR